MSKNTTGYIYWIYLFGLSVVNVCFVISEVTPEHRSNLSAVAQALSSNGE